MKQSTGRLRDFFTIAGKKIGCISLRLLAGQQRGVGNNIEFAHGRLTL